MSRSPTAGQAAELAKTVGARPGYLVELGFDTVLRMTSFESSVTWNSQTWTAEGISVSGIKHEGRSGQTARITLPDGAGAYFAVIRADGLDDRTAKIWSVHGGPASYDPSDPIQLFDGYMDGAPELGERVVINLTTQGNRVQWTPNMRIEPGVFNWLPPPGSRYSWNGSTWTIARAPE